MGNRRGRARSAAAREQYSVDTEWTEADLALLEKLKRKEALLPADALRGLVSVRLSVLTEDTTSPVRQELDLRILALEQGIRVVGVASDLNVSATKVPPWKRKQLGDWLNNRAPEFDVLLFWKMDRFIRRLTDLSTMIDWCLKYGKNLISRNDTLDLTTAVGKILATLIGGLAEIEATNTSTRVTSLWDYTKTQSDWLVGKPTFGYVTTEDEKGNVVLAIDEDAHRALRWCHQAALRGVSTRRMAIVLKRSGLCGSGLTTATLLRRLRNPALLGYRVEEDKNGGIRRSKLILGRDGKPIRVAPPIFTEEEFDALQAALDRRSTKQPTRQPGGATKFLGVLICSDCKSNMNVQHTVRTVERPPTPDAPSGESPTVEVFRYAYLRCQKCRSGGLGAPNPDVIYAKLVEDVLSVLGDEPVQIREYARGEEARKELKRLEEAVAYYMRELAPGGRFAKTRFTREQGQETLDKLIADLEAIDPDTAQDRWMNVHNGKTFRQQWEAGGIGAMSADLLRVGIKCEVTRTKIPRQRAPQVHLKLMIPKDVRDRLVIKPDDFADVF
ncbi:recombinase family protein [Kitasatospora kifunensis]|uniref:DNA invertase Pin-like site-specific DNA recombinase n=1 Tax=Kitasatospora kifunensis TaxID=58351 RepID=A0A7W7R0I2_KITKI|nr:recombinase family protein [Kitasatospora kifunensis]MBB4923200.1 DNA invertase Pin-like site-specific DNA recombinase [Kitasatospora kifunensis]